MTRPRFAFVFVVGLVLGAPHPARAEDPPPDAVATLLASPFWAKRVEGLRLLATRAGDEAAAEAARRLLADPDWEVAIEAARTLGAIGTKAAEDALLDACVHAPIQWLRDAAVDRLGRWDAAETAERLRSLARRLDDQRLVARAIGAFGRVAPAEALPRLRTWLGARDLGVAAAAADAVGDVVARHPEAAKEALHLLRASLTPAGERKRFLVYAAAIGALGRIDAPEARVELLRQLLAQPDDDPYVPTRIARCLEEDDPAAVRDAARAVLPQARTAEQRRRLVRFAADARLPALAPLVEELGSSGDEERLQAEAVRALGLLEDRAAADGLVRALSSTRSVRVRREVVAALARVLEPRRFRDLLPVVLVEPEAAVRLDFVVALADQDDPAAIPPLASFTRDRDWRVRTAAIASIGTLGVAKDLPVLLPFLESRDWKVRATAYEALGRLRAARAVPVLTRGLEDEDPAVRGVCEANLQILTQEKLGPDPKAWRAWWTKHGADLVLLKRSRMTDAQKKREEAERSRTRYAHELYRFDRKRGLEILQKARILVVTGAWDHVEVVLDHLDIPHTTLRAQQLETAGLNPNQVVLVNCEGNVDKDAQERLRWFVNVGGYLMTTDWALTKTIDLCFPGCMKQYSGSTTGNDVVRVEETLPGHPYTRGIFQGVPALLWWLEVRAFPLVVTYPERCDVIVDSAEMRQRYGSSPMATTFRWGLGRVQHSVSHFYLQEEAFAKATKPLDRMIFAADHLGLSLAQIRDLRAKGAFEGSLTEASMKEIAPDYSMFRLIVNFVAEKEAWVEGL